MKTRNPAAVSSSSGNNFTKGIMLPEGNEDPSFVVLPMTRHHGRGGSCWRIDSSECFPSGTIMGKIRSDSYHGFEHLESLLIDGVSKENDCVKRIQKKYLQRKNDSLRVKGVHRDSMSVHWRNTILVVKSEKPASRMSDPEAYDDITLADVPDVVEFVVKISLMCTAR
jgi:hypothetical protein